MNYNFYASPPSYDSYIKKLCSLKRDYPFLKLTTIGQSVLSREIYGVTIGNESKVVLFAAAFHAQEWLTCSLMIRYIEEIAPLIKQELSIFSYDLNEVVKERGLMIIPMVNPDGVSIALEGAESAGGLSGSVRTIMERGEESWQANARGVDLNHNFNAGFEKIRELEKKAGITAPSSRRYGGEYPHSEPETRALVSLLANNNIETAYAFHSQGEEIFYEYGLNTPDISYEMASILSKASGYSLVKNQGLYSHGGFKDYFIEKYHRPGFTIEIGKGENPLPITELDTIYNKLLKMLVIATVI